MAGGSGRKNAGWLLPGTSAATAKPLAHPLASKIWRQAIIHVAYQRQQPEIGAISVKANQSGIRVLEVLEAVAANQPISLAGLARMIDADKNAIQRALVTLHEAGWIEPSTGAGKGWALTSRIFTVANWTQGRSDLRSRVKPELEALREASGETSLLTIPENQHFLVADVVESRQVLRTAPAIGTIVLPQRSATGYAILSYLPPEAQIAMLGQLPDDDLLEKLGRTLQDGYAVAVNTPVEGITVIAAPIFDVDGLPIAAISIVAPTDRVPQKRREEFGKLVTNAANRLSRSTPAASR